MNKSRKIITIDEAKCNGCGQCILACAEGALKLVNGKAKLVGDIYCDGLGACIGECPEGALKIIERTADDFDEKKVEELLQKNESQIDIKPLACGCPSSAMMEFKNKPCCENGSADAKQVSHLRHWPVKLQLLGPNAPFLKGADLVLLADCAGIACPELHTRILKNHAIAIGCPKLDNLEAHIERLALILKEAQPKSLKVVHMEVPCCSGFVYAAQQAIERSGVNLPLSHMVIGRQGDILAEEEL
jgi:ferredoxin